MANYILELEKVKKKLSTNNNQPDGLLYDSKIKIIQERYKISNLIISYEKIISKCLNDARNNEVKKAIRLFHGVMNSIDFSNFNLIEKTMFNINSFPVRAYLEYKSNDFVTAIDTTNLIMFEIIDLEKENDFLLYFRIQQLHNISRVLVKEKKYEETVDIIILLFDFLVLNKSINYEKHFFKFNKTNNLELHNLFILQVFNETISYFDRNILDYNLYFEKCFKNILEIQTVLDNEQKIVYLWASMKNKLLNNQEIIESEIDEYVKLSEYLNSELSTTILLNDLKKETA
jgi:hypothetical protein